MNNERLESNRLCESYYKITSAAYTIILGVRLLEFGFVMVNDITNTKIKLLYIIVRAMLASRTVHFHILL